MSEKPEIETIKLKKKWVGDSILGQIKYKLWIWKFTWPMYLYKLGFNCYDLIAINLMSTYTFKPPKFLRKLFEVRIKLIESNSSMVIEQIENKEIGVDELLDPISGQRLVHLAVIYENEYLLDYLISNGANLMVRDYLGFTPLLKASCLGRYQSFVMLVEAGVPISHTDNHKNTALQKAQFHNNLNIVEYLESLPTSKFNEEKSEYWLKKPLSEVYKTKLLFHKSLY